MPPRLRRATLATFGVLGLMLAFVLLPTIVVVGPLVPLLWVLGIGAFAAIGLFLGPWLLDLQLRFFMRSRRLTLDEFAQEHPEQGQFLRELCAQHSVPEPQLRLLDSMTPNAFTYGSTPRNVRIALSTGLLHYLDRDEANAVVAHEVGHIKHWDFVVMTLLSTLLVLLEVSADLAANAAKRIQEGDKKGKAGAVVAVLTAVAVLGKLFAWLGSYLVLYVSRIREYMADAFAAQHGPGARAMQRALIRVGYGILDRHRLRDSANPNVLVGVQDQFSFLADAEPADDWSQAALPAGAWHESDASTSVWARRTFVLPPLEQVAKTAHVSAGWFRRRPPNGIEELPDLALRLGEEGITKAYVNGAEVDLTGGALAFLSKGSATVTAATLRAGENVLAMEIDPDKVGKTGSFRVQLGWPSNNVYPWTAEQDARRFASVAQMCVTSPTAPSAAPPLSSDDHVLPQALADLMLFDLASPWAKVLELLSTHPLTGKRLVALNAFTKEGEQPFVETDRLEARIAELDKTRLHGAFGMESAIFLLPQIALLVSLAAAVLLGFTGVGVLFVPAVVLVLVGAAVVLRGLYRYPRSNGFEPLSGFFSLFTDPYASPLRGRPVMVRGHLIGKGQAGSVFGEDMMMVDEDGNLLYLNYESVLPLLGNLWFGARTFPSLLGEAVVVTGWYRRGAASLVDLHDLVVEDGRVFPSSVRFWTLFGGGVLVGLGIGAACLVLGVVFPPLWLLSVLSVLAVPAALLGAKLASNRRKARFTPEEVARFLAMERTGLAS